MQNDYPVGGLAKISLANVPVEDRAGGAMFAIVLSLLACYGMTAWAVWCINRSWRLVIHRRTAQLLNKANADATSVLVLNPPTSAPMEKEKLEQLWHELHPGNVLDVCMILDTGKLPKLLPKHNKLRRRVEYLGKQDGKKRVGCCKSTVLSEVSGAECTDAAECANSPRLPSLACFCLAPHPGIAPSLGRCDAPLPPAASARHE